MKLPVHTVSAAGLVQRGDEVLLIKNPRRGWEFPGGMVEQGESVLQALVREIEEETGVRVCATAFVGAYSNTTLKEGYGELAGTMLPTSLNLTFLCEYESGEIRTSDESLEVRWVKREDAPEMITFAPFKRRLADMLEYSGTPKFSAFRNVSGQYEEVENIVF